MPDPHTARRERLTELDALTDQIGPLLDRMAAIWREVERDLARAKTQTASPSGR